MEQRRWRKSVLQMHTGAREAQTDKETNSILPRLFYAQCLLHFQLIVRPKTMFLPRARYFHWLPEDSKSCDRMQTGWTRRWLRSILTVTAYWLFWALPGLFGTRIMSCVEMFLFPPAGLVALWSLCFQSQQHQSNTCKPRWFQQTIVQWRTCCKTFNSIFLLSTFWKGNLCWTNSF